MPKAQHGAVFADSWFSGCAWSPDEQRVAYVAEARASAPAAGLISPVGAAPDKRPMQEPMGEELPEWGRWRSAPGGMGPNGKLTAMPRAWKGVGDRQVQFILFLSWLKALILHANFLFEENQVRKTVRDIL